MTKSLFLRTILFALCISGLEYFWVETYVSGETLQTIRLTQIFALTALTYLYFTILENPIRTNFRNFKSWDFYSNIKPALIISTFYFGLLHASFAFFGQLGGFEGLGFLGDKFLLAITLSFTALCILFFLSVRTRDLFIQNRGRLNIVNNFLYIAGVLILTHALMLGTHFQVLSNLIPKILFVALSVLLFLEILRIDSFFKKRYSSGLKVSIASVPLFILLAIVIVYFLIPLPKNLDRSFGIHSQHIQMANDAQLGNTSNSNTVNNPKIPGLQGDRTKRYTVSFNNPENAEPGQDTTLSFQVYDASSGNKIRLFNKLNDKIAHFIIVDSELNFFNHIHPEQSENEFSIVTQFPHDGRYHLYLDFQPFGAIEQQFAFTLDVGMVEIPKLSNAKLDTKLTKTFGEYEVDLSYPKPLKSSELSTGQQILSYTIKDARTKKPITNLKPYLAAFGHMVMINNKTYDYIHVHPNDPQVPKPDQNGGPKVEFMPLGLYGPIKPGVYRVFAQFNPDNNLFTADYTIEIK